MMSHAFLRNVLIKPSVCRNPAAVWQAQPAQLFSLRGFRSLAPSRVLVRATVQAERPAEQSDAPYSFADLGLAPGLQQALVEAHITEPTEIQVNICYSPPTPSPQTRPREACPATSTFTPTRIRAGLVPNLLGTLNLPSRFVREQIAAFAEVLKGGDVLLASHTGSGKTLAYLLPLVRLRATRYYSHDYYSRVTRALGQHCTDARTWIAQT